MGYQTQFTAQTCKNYDKIFKALKRLNEKETSIFPENIQCPAPQIIISNYNQMRKSLKHHF